MTTEWDCGCKVACCCEKPEQLAPPAVPISVEGLEEAIDRLGKAYWRMIEEQFNGDEEYRAARSSLKALFSKLVEERDAALARLQSELIELRKTNEEMQQDLYRYDDALGRGLTDDERARRYD